MRWGILGIGRVTPRMVQAIRLSGEHEIVAVAARNELKLREWAATHVVPEEYVDFQALIESDRSMLCMSRSAVAASRMVDQSDAGVAK